MENQQINNSETILKQSVNKNDIVFVLRLSGKTIGTIVLGVASALVLGAGMCMVKFQKEGMV